MASVFESILDAVQTAVQVASSGASVIPRKSEFIWPNDGKPLIVVEPGIDRDTAYAFSNAVHREYQVFVVLAWPGNKQLEAPFGDVPELRQAIKRALDTPTLTGVSEVYNVMLPGGTPLYEPAGFPSNYERSVLEVNYWTAEVRNE